MQQIAVHAFEPSHDIPPLADDEIHLWLSLAPQAVKPRALSALAHAELGRLLQAYAGVDRPPAIARGEHGKPYALDMGFPQFNLSHSGQCIVFAFARDQEIGVDVEALRRRHSPIALAERFFAAEEVRALAALDPSEQGAAFVRLWTCKEAVLKALGRGIAFGLDRLCFSLDASQMPGSLQYIADEAGLPADWQLCRFDPAPGHIGALAWRGQPRRVRTFRLG
jgi:4'-phosphopantetheinyl transferase